MSMYKEFEEKYPLLFRNKDEREPINLFGIECRSGWKSLLNNAFRLMYRKYKHELSLHQYWTEKKIEEPTTPESADENLRIYINRLKSADDLQKAESQLPTVAQIKEKFGTLRMYCDNVDDYARGVIDMAETLSGETCEACGGKGKPVGGRWVQTLCEECNQPQQTN
jgi:hypothetical protein